VQKVMPWNPKLRRWSRYLVEVESRQQRQTYDQAVHVSVALSLGVVCPAKLDKDYLASIISQTS
jgi:hypothetical protein